jgi:hypothetical protein
VEEVCGLFSTPYFVEIDEPSISRE